MGDHGELASGSKINEQELASRYGISRGPLREALQRLEQRHLVERIPHVGAPVVRMTPEKLMDLYRARRTRSHGVPPRRRAHQRRTNRRAQ